MAPGTRVRSGVEPLEIINRALDEVENLPATIEHGEEFRDDSGINIEPVSARLKQPLNAINDDSYQSEQGYPTAYGQCRTASATNEMLAVVLHLIDRFENIIQRQVRTFFHEPGHQLGFP